MDEAVAFKIISAALIFIMLIYYMKRRNKLLSLLFGCVSGFAALLLLNNCGEYLNSVPPLNTFNVVGSCTLGVPFVVGIAIICNI